MTSRDFCYWLQGFLEVAKPATLTRKQVDEIKKHLAMVFIHEIDPSAGGPKEQAALNAAHGSGGEPVYRC